MCESGDFIGWYVDTIRDIATASKSISSLEAPVIADVATFSGDIFDPPQVLHVGVGYVNALVVLFPKPDGELVAAVGPVFSYYEFKLIGMKRLNDGEWKEMLTWENRTEYLPEYLLDIYGIAEPWPAPEYSNVKFFILGLITLSTLFLTVFTVKKIRKKRSKLAN